MNMLRRFVAFGVAGVVGGAIACGGGDSTGPTAGSVTGIFGENDSSLTGGTLNVGFTVLGADGFPLRGARVTWTVTPSAAASINPATQSSDSVGVVAAAVQLGTTVGSFTATANVNGVAPVVFHLKALDACLYVQTYALGDSVAGSLSRTDCRVTFSSTFSAYYDYYQMDLPSGQQSIRINEGSFAGSGKFDPFVELYRLSGEQLGWDDDIVPADTQTSQLDILLGDGGSFVIGATSYDPDTLGNYWLRAKTRVWTLKGCQDAWLTPGVTFTDTIGANDCVDTGPLYSDVAYIYMQGSDVIEVAERSTALNPLLRLYWANLPAQRFDLIATNDDSSAGNPNAYISYTVPDDGWYLLQIGAAAVGDSGQYTLAFFATGPSAPKSSTLGRRLRTLPRGTFRGWKKHN